MMARSPLERGAGTVPLRHGQVVRRYLIAFGVIGVFALLLGSDLPPEVKRAVSGLGQMLGSLAVSAACLYRFRLSTGRRRQAWLLFAIAGLFGAAGAIGLWAASPDAAGDPVSPANAAITLALLSGVAGIVLYPSVPRRLTEMIRIVLDGVVLGGSILYIASLAVFPQILANTTTPYPARLLPLASPVVEIVIATVAALLYWRAAPADRTSLGLAAIGFSLYAISASALAIRTAQGKFMLGSITDLGWIAGHVILALGISLAGYEAHPTDRPERLERKELSPVLGTYVMFGLFLAAGLANLIVTPGPADVPAAVLWLIVLLAVAGRQIFVILDNERLRRDLEIRVAERTSALNSANQRNVLLLNSVGDGIYGVDRGGAITFVNPAAAHALGFGQQELTGRNAHVLFHAPAPDGSPTPIEACYITEAIRDRVVTSAEDDLYTRADGLQIPVEVTATPLIDEDRVTGAVVVFRDVTQRREVDRMKSEFVSMVSHELRTPLTSIRGALGLLSGGALGPLAPNASRMIDIALESSERLTRLINDILDIERIEAGVVSMKLAFDPIDELIASAVNQVQLLAEQSGITLRTVAPPTLVYVDADRVVQTLVNLIGNAIKFSPDHTEVRVVAIERGTFVEVAIHDQGRGIPESKLEEIFARFQQVDSSDARAKGGSGLGLAISRSLVERLGGRIWAENNPEGGATFRFTLPTEAEFPVRADDVTIPLESTSTPSAAPAPSEAGRVGTV
jgi:PAS domain S-box-containing protein